MCGGPDSINTEDSAHNQAEDSVFRWRQNDATGDNGRNNGV
jgi:hypothetical protein